MIFFLTNQIKFHSEVLKTKITNFTIHSLTHGSPLNLSFHMRTVLFK